MCENPSKGRPRARLIQTKRRSRMKDSPRGALKKPAVASRPPPTLRRPHVRSCEGFRMPAPWRRRHIHRGAGVRKPPGQETAGGVGVAMPRARRGRYGDLIGVDRAAECKRRNRLRPLGRLAGGGGLCLGCLAGSVSEDRRSRTGVKATSLRAPSWPVRHQRMKRAAFRCRGSGVDVMRCRS